MVIGKVRNSNTGLIIVLIRPKASAVASAATIFSTLTPGKKYAVTIIATLDTNQPIKSSIHPLYQYHRKQIKEYPVLPLLCLVVAKRDMSYDLLS